MSPRSRACLAALALVAATGRAVASDDGLDFLRPRDVAFVEVAGRVESPGGAPVAGADVLVLWKAASDGFHATNYRCLRVDAARTDAQGRFSLSAPLAEVYEHGLSQQGVDVRIHAPGLEWTQREAPADAFHVERQRVFTPRAWLNAGVVDAWHLRLLARTRAPAGDAQDHLRWLVELTARAGPCEHAGNGVAGFYASVADEGATLARTPYERGLSDALALRARQPLDPIARAPAEDALLAAPVRRASVARSSDGRETRWDTGVPDDPDARDAQDRTPLMHAAAAGDLAGIQRALAAGAKPGRQTWNRADSALTLAIEGAKLAGLDRLRAADRARYEAAVDALLDAPGVDVELRDGEDRTPLMRAMGSPHVVASLLAHGADPNAVAGPPARPRDSVLGQAMALGFVRSHDDVVAQLRQLVATGRVAPDRPFNAQGETPLTHALRDGEVAMVRFWLEAGADPEAPETSGQTPAQVTRAQVALNPSRANYREALQVVETWPRKPGHDRPAATRASGTGIAGTRAPR